MATYNPKNSIAKISLRLQECEAPLVVIFSPSPIPTNCNFCAHLQESNKAKGVFEAEQWRVVGVYDRGVSDDDLFEDCRCVFDDYFPGKDFRFTREVN